MKHAMQINSLSQVSALRRLIPYQCHAYYRNEEHQLHPLGSCKLWASHEDAAKRDAWHRICEEPSVGLEQSVGLTVVEAFEMEHLEAFEMEHLEVIVTVTFKADEGEDYEDFVSNNLADALDAALTDYSLEDCKLEASVDHEELMKDLKRAMDSLGPTPDDVLVEAERLGSENLDELVHQVASKIATDVNNGGKAAQVEFLIEHLGLEEALEALLDIERSAMAGGLEQDCGGEMVTQELIERARQAATNKSDLQVVDQIEAELRANDATDEEAFHNWSHQSEAELYRIIMKNSQIKALGEHLYNHAFNIVDAEPELSGDDAGKVAKAVEEAFVQALRSLEDGS